MEDQEADVSLVTDQLAREFIPCDFTWVSGGPAFDNALLDGWVYDLLLIGMDRPEGPGEAALEAVSRRYPDLPVLLLTGAALEDRGLELLRQGAIDSVPKDRLARLAPAVRRALAQAHALADRRAAEAANARLISLLRATLESTAEGILVVDLAGKITTYNRKFMSLCGIPEYVMAPMELDRVLQFLMDQFKDPEAFLAETRLLRTRPESESSGLLSLKDDRVLEETGRPHRLGNQTVGRVFSFRESTGPDKPAPRTKAVSGAGEVLLAAVQAGRAVPWATADDTLILPDYAADTLALDPADLPRTLSDLAGLVHPEDQNHFLEALERPVHAAFEARLLRGDGQWLATRWSLDRTPEGGYAGLFLDASRDVAARAAELQGLRGQWLNSLTASVTRALRAPVEGLQASFSQLQAALPLGAPSPAMEAARGHLASLAVLIADMGRATDREPGFRGMLDLDELVEKVRPWAASALGPGIHLVHDPCPGLPALPLNAARMEPVLMNLLLNARDAVEGSGEIRVRTGLKKANGLGPALFLEVQDDGPGIPPKVREQMFDPFFSTRPEHKGLGLPVARCIVESYGGFLEVDTSASTGTTVRVVLPSN